MKSKEEQAKWTKLAEKQRRWEYIKATFSAFIYFILFILSLYHAEWLEMILSLSGLAIFPYIFQYIKNSPMELDFDFGHYSCSLKYSNFFVVLLAFVAANFITTITILLPALATS